MEECLEIAYLLRLLWYKYLRCDLLGLPGQAFLFASARHPFSHNPPFCNLVKTLLKFMPQTLVCNFVPVLSFNCSGSIIFNPPPLFLCVDQYLLYPDVLSPPVVLLLAPCLPPAACLAELIR